MDFSLQTPQHFSVAFLPGLPALGQDFVPFIYRPVGTVVFSSPTISPKLIEKSKLSLKLECAGKLVYTIDCVQCTVYGGVSNLSEKQLAGRLNPDSGSTQPHCTGVHCTQWGWREAGYRHCTAAACTANTLLLSLSYPSSHQHCWAILANQR